MPENCPPPLIDADGAKFLALGSVKVTFLTSKGGRIHPPHGYNRSLTSQLSRGTVFDKNGKMNKLKRVLEVKFLIG
jgi:hypothetical protein